MGVTAPSWIGKSKKEKWGKDGDEPWMRLSQPMFGGQRIIEVVKSWQQDWLQDYARVLVKTWMETDDPSHWDGGDEYVHTVMSRSTLVLVDGRAPTDEELAEFGQLKQMVEALPDPHAEIDKMMRPEPEPSDAMKVIRDGIEALRPEAKEYLAALEGKPKMTENHYGAVMATLSGFEVKSMGALFLVALVREGYPKGTAMQLVNLMGYSSLVVDLMDEVPADA